MNYSTKQPTTTLFVGNIDPRVDRKALYEVAVQAGPVAEVVIPTDAVTGRAKAFGFVVSLAEHHLPTSDETSQVFHNTQLLFRALQDYESLESAKYALRLFSGNLVLYGRSVRLDYSPKGRTE